MTTELNKPNRKNKLARIRRYPIFAILILLIFIIMALFADFITPDSPYDQDIPNRLQPPVWMDDGSWDHPLGTDSLGRDSLSRIIYGARITMLVALACLLAGGVIGLMVGILSGYFGGWVDSVLMRLTDTALAIPTIFLALLLAVTLGSSFTTVIVAISLIVWSRFARVIRGDTLRIKEHESIALARVAGCSQFSIIIRHIMPNVLNTFIVLASLELGAVILMESMLSFLGAGVPPPTPTWGSLVASGREYIASYWWLALFPGFAITLVVLSLNMLGDWIRDTFDPKLRQSL